MKTCIICNKQLVSGQKNCCSQKCYGAYRSKYFIGKNNPKHKQQKCICEYCKKEFYVNQSRVKSGKNKHCSRECADKHKSEWMLKTKNPNWKGGKFTRKDGYVLVHIHGSQYILEHRMIKEINDPNLIVHHKDGNPSNNDAENLEIMTKDEHNKIHNVNRKQHGFGTYKR